jgi:hypothetical protein
MRLGLAVVLVASLAPAASADGFYFTESIGGVRVEDRLGDLVDDGLRARIAVGWRGKRWAIEGHLAFTGGDRYDEQTGLYETREGLTTYGIDVKYIQPLSRRLELYVRGTASRGVLTGSEGDFSGRGLGIGGGVQLKGKVPVLALLFWPVIFIPKVPGPKMTGSLYVENGFEFYRLHPDGALDATPSIDAKLSHVMFGFAVGSDF